MALRRKRVSKIIIDNRSSQTDEQAIQKVLSVMELGRVSNNGKQYCYITAFSDDVLVATDLNKCSDRFIVQDN